MGQMMTRSPEEGIKNAGCHTARRRGKKFPGAELGVLKMREEKSEMVTEAHDHAVKAGSQENWVLLTVISRAS